MHFVDRHREKIRQSPMSSRLLWACLLLVVLLVLTFGAALFLFASLHNTKKDISRSLQIQFSVFQNDMERYFDQLAVMGVNLSEDMSAEVDKELALRQMSFAQLNDSPEVLNALEEKISSRCAAVCARPAVPVLLCCWMPPSTPAWREQSIPAPGCMCRKAVPTPPPCPCCCTGAVRRWARPTA